ncbi:unnamed protein product, partial [Adineta steineri]
FRTNLVEKGFWYGFSILSSPTKPTVGLVYALRWQENDTESLWDIYNVTESGVIILPQNHTSLVIFQRLTSSGLLTVQPLFNVTSFLNENQCLYFVYMRGRFFRDRPLIPDDIYFNQSLCLTCQRSELISTIEPVYYNSTIEEDTTFFVEDTSTITNSIQSSSSSIYKKEIKFFWFGRITNRLWSNDYYNFTSILTQKLRLDLQNLFLSLINSNSSYSFICNQFEFYSLKSGSILFASNITLISNLSEDETINIIKKLINTINDSNDDNNKLDFDRSVHNIKRTNELSQIKNLFKNLTRIDITDFSRQAEFDSTLHLLIGCIISIGVLMLLITSILCLYGYYKCRRRQFRRFTQRSTLKFKQDLNSYTWLGQQPSINSSSPYLIQSTSI